MGLRYGFHLYPPSEWTKEKAEEKRKEKYEKLTDEEKKFYHNDLCWLCFMTDIGFISKKTIPHMIKRHDYKTYYSDKKKQETILNEKFLSRFIGYECNVLTLSDIAFFRKLKKAYDLHKQNDFLSNEKQLEKTKKEYYKNIYNSSKI